MAHQLELIDGPLAGTCHELSIPGLPSFLEGVLPDYISVVKRGLRHGYNRVAENRYYYTGRSDSILPIFRIIAQAGNREWVQWGPHDYSVLYLDTVVEKAREAGLFFYIEWVADPEHWSDED